MNSVSYKTIWVEIRQPLFCLFVGCNGMFLCLDSSVGWSNVDCLFWHFSILWHGSISTVFQSSFIVYLATEFVLVTLSIVVTICFATQAQLFGTPEFFYKQSRFLLSCFLWAVQHVHGKKLPVAFAVKLSVQSRKRIASHLFFFSGRIMSSKFSSDRAKYRESVSISSSSFFSVSQNLLKKLY